MSNYSFNLTNGKNSKKIVVENIKELEKYIGKDQLPHGDVSVVNGNKILALDNASQLALNEYRYLHTLPKLKDTTFFDGKISEQKINELNESRVIDAGNGVFFGRGIEFANMASQLISEKSLSDEDVTNSKKDCLLVYDYKQDITMIQDMTGQAESLQELFGRELEQAISPIRHTLVNVDGELQHKRDFKVVGQPDDVRAAINTISELEGDELNYAWHGVTQEPGFNELSQKPTSDSPGSYDPSMKFR